MTPSGARARASFPGPALALALAFALCGRAAAAQEPSRGPLRVREEWLLATQAMVLSPRSADPLPAGSTELRLDGSWGSDFAWVPEPGRREFDEIDAPWFLVDGEHRVLGLAARHGLGGATTIGARLPVRWRGPGVLDDPIEGFHALFGFPNAGRELQPQGRLRVEGALRGGGRLAWPGEAGTGLGNLEVEVSRSLRRGDRWRAAAGLQAALPTATGPFADAGGGAGALLAGSVALGRFDLHAGAGVVRQAASEAEGVAYAPWRSSGWLAVEWRVARRLSLVAQGEAASRLVEGLPGHPGLHSYLRIGGRLALGQRWELEAAFSEGLVSQDSTTDVEAGLALGRRF